MSTGKRINYHHTLGWKACKYKPLQQCSMLMESLMSSANHVAAVAIELKSKALWNHYCHSWRQKSNDCPTWISVRGIGSSFVIRKAWDREREREGVVRSHAYSTVHLSQPFLAPADFSLFTEVRVLLSGWDAASYCHLLLETHVLVLFSYSTTWFLTQYTHIIVWDVFLFLQHIMTKQIWGKYYYYIIILFQAETYSVFTFIVWLYKVTTKWKQVINVLYPNICLWFC